MTPKNKTDLDFFTLNTYVDLYTTIAGITSGYISVVRRDFNLTKEQAEQEALKLEMQARAKVAEAYRLYDKSKEECDGS